MVSPGQLGDKKQAACPDTLIEFLQKECRDADGLVLSVDMLLYGGLVPSRLHHLDTPSVQKRLEVIEELKRQNPDLLVYAFQTIMRCPRSSDGGEGPSYYDRYGRELSEIGTQRHQYQLGMNDGVGLEALYGCVDEKDLADYQRRRNFNLQFLMSGLELVQRGVIDFMVIPQDDTERFGFTAMDQEEIVRHIRGKNLQDRVLLYPGADEVGLVLASRMALHFAGRTPRVFVRYAAQAAPFMVPLYEDRPLGETIKYQLLAAGCRWAYSPAEADFVLAVNCPAQEMREAVMQPLDNRFYTIERNITEFVWFIEDCIENSWPVVVADNAYNNGGDLELVALLNKRGLLDKLSGYAGWGTSSNTLGTTIAQGVHLCLCGADPAHKHFIYSRLAEDVGYCASVRREITEYYLPEWSVDAYDTSPEQEKLHAAAKELLQNFCNQELSSLKGLFTIKSVSMPWKRMFEAKVELQYNSF